MRPIVTAAALLFASPAWAGGVGLVLNGGMHTDRVYYYSDTENTDEGPVLLEDQDLWPQYELATTVVHAGSGLEILLGDRDDKIMGLFRFYGVADMPQLDPMTLDVSDLDAEITSMDTVHSNVRDEIEVFGVASVGLNWGVFGNPDTAQLGFTAQLGSGFLAQNHNEFLQANLGPMVTWKVARQVQLFGDATYQVRYRKGFSHGGNLAVGVRYLFD